jgi:hypothetical protein
MNCGINDISFESFKPSMANAQLQALQYVQNKFGRESLILGAILARLFEEKKSSYCRHSGVSVCVSVSVSVWVG